MNKSIAHNVALSDGKGQKKDVDAIGKFTYDDSDAINMDLTDAYENVERYNRSIGLAENKESNECVMMLHDVISSEEDVSVILPFHTVEKPEIRGNSVVVKRDNCELTITVTQGELRLKETKDKYDVDLNEGVPTEYQITIPQQYHIYYETPKAKRH